MKKILAVDDEPGYREMYVYLLEPMGVEVFCVCNGQEAVDKIKEMPFDLILMDVHMPILTGPEAFKQIKKIRPDQKIVIFTSSSDPAYEMEKEVIGEGAIDCLYKPVAFDELEKLIHQILFGTSS